jgi:hypothetical protein
MALASRLLPLLLVLAPLPACAHGPTGDDPIAAAVREYVRTETAVDSVEVVIEAVEGDYARVRVRPVGAETDPAVLFLRRIDGRWRGIAIGTAFDPEFYEREGIPPALRVP